MKSKSVTVHSLASNCTPHVCRHFTCGISQLFHSSVFNMCYRMNECNICDVNTAPHWLVDLNAWRIHRLLQPCGKRSWPTECVCASLGPVWEWRLHTNQHAQWDLHRRQGYDCGNGHGHWQPWCQKHIHMCFCEGKFRVQFKHFKLRNVFIEILWNCPFGTEVWFVCGTTRTRIRRTTKNLPIGGSTGTVSASLSTSLLKLSWGCSPSGNNWLLL